EAMSCSEPEPGKNTTTLACDSGMSPSSLAEQQNAPQLRERPIWAPCRQKFGSRLHRHKHPDRGLHRVITPSMTHPTGTYRACIRSC
ncbi:Hypothetical predicted protein, partial [Pelobates cultripes]